MHGARVILSCDTQNYSHRRPGGGGGGGGAAGLDAVIHSLSRVATLSSTERGSGGLSLFLHSSLWFITPRAHARARGYVIGRGVYILRFYKILQKIPTSILAHA